MNSLDFQDFASSRGNSASSFATAPALTEQATSGNLLDSSSEGAQQVGTAKPHFLTMAFYQRFFDVDEETVFTRILNSAFPRARGNFIADFIQPNPDLWGPFWISTTLVFLVAIVGNFANFVKYYDAGLQQNYASDFSFVTGAASLVFGYVLLAPSLAYTFLWYHRAVGLQYSFFDLLSAYGYSLSIFVPASILCPLLPFNSARLALTLVAAVFSGAVLAIALWSTVKEDPNRLSAFGFTLAIFVANALLALCLKEFYFDSAGFPVDHPPVLPPSPAPGPQPTTATNSTG